MPVFDGELGLQFVTHLANHYTVPDLVRLAQLAAAKGFKQIWVNDNIRYRGQLVVMTAIAACVPIRLGTAIMVPYFHNPLDMADSFAALSEMCGNKEISIGVAPRRSRSVTSARSSIEAHRNGKRNSAIPPPGAGRRRNCLRRISVLAGVLPPQSKRKISTCVQTASNLQILRRRQWPAIAPNVRAHYGRFDQLGDLYTYAQSRSASGNARNRG